MASLIQEYAQTEQQLKALQEKLKNLEDNPALQKELEFKNKLTELMREFDKSAKDVVALLNPEGHAVKSASDASSKRRKRKLKVYKNPKTGEVVETRGGNQKTLKAWKDEFGADVVEGWLIEERPDA